MVAAEARGFIFAAPLALALQARFIPVRKPGKLPFDTHSFHYELEYGTDALEMHTDAISRGDRVLMVDDLLATGGTMGACIGMVEKVGGVVVGTAFLIELDFLKARKRLAPVRGLFADALRGRDLTGERSAAADQPAGSYSCLFLSLSPTHTTGRCFSASKSAGRSCSSASATARVRRLPAFAASTSTPAAAPPAIREQIEQTGRELFAEFPFQAVGFGFGGPINGPAGIVTTSHQVEGWDNFPLAAMVHARRSACRRFWATTATWPHWPKPVSAPAAASAASFT